jgi:hypothetical protein
MKVDNRIISKFVSEKITKIQRKMSKILLNLGFIETEICMRVAVNNNTFSKRLNLVVYFS